MTTIGFFYLCRPSEHTIALKSLAVFPSVCVMLPFTMALTTSRLLLTMPYFIPQPLLFVHIWIKRIPCTARQLDMVAPTSLVLVLWKLLPVTSGKGNLQMI
jgi:hypothetical protein